MTLTTWKYRLVFGIQMVAIPTGARILSVQYQHMWPHMWVLLDPLAPNEHRKILVAATGAPIPSDARYISTFQMDEGNSIFHGFELPVIKDTDV